MFRKNKKYYSKAGKQDCLFIVVGRLGKNLVVSKTLPVVYTRLFSHIYIFSEEEGINVDGVEYITLPGFVRRIRPSFMKKFVRRVYEPLQLTFYAWRLRPSVIHGYYSLPKGLNSLIASRLSNSRCIISIIGGEEEIESSFFIQKLSRPFIIWLLKRAHHITTKGQKDNEYLFRFGIKEENLSIFNGAIDTKRFAYHEEKKDVDLLFAGYINESKGSLRAMEIIRIVKEELPNVKAIFIGNGPLYQNLIDTASRLNLSENISFEGFVENSESFFNRSKILVFPSSNEGLSTAMLEAMACRCVPITSDVGNQTEAAINGHNSVVVTDYLDVRGFAENAIRLLKDKVELNRLAENALNIIHDKYSQEAQGLLCQQFYSKIIRSDT